MKILIVSDYFQPVIGYAKVQIAKSLIKKGHEVRVLTSDRYFPFHNYDQTVKSLLGKRQRKAGIQNEDGILVERKKTLLEFFSRVLYIGVQSTILQFNPDLVIVFGISSPSAIQVALQKNKHTFRLVFADSHLPSEFESGHLGTKNIFYFVFRTFFSHIIEKAGDKFIALQDDTKKIISNVYGISAKVEVVPNGTDLSVFRFSRQEREKIRKYQNISSDAFVIIYTGKLIKQKGLEILFQAFSKLCESHNNIFLLVVGSGSESYKAKLQNESINKNIVFVPSLPHTELYKYYSAADVAVWPLQESLAMNDAAACGLPFIANDEMGDKTRVSAHNALLYKKGDTVDLQQKLVYLLTNKQKRAAMGKRGQELMRAKFSWDVLTERYL